MVRKPKLLRLNPGYDQRGNSPWHWLEAEVPQELYFAFFSDRPIAPHWRPLTVGLMRERKQGDFFFLHGLFAATKPAVEVIRRLLGDKLEALPVRLKGHKRETKGVPPLFLLHPLQVAELSKSAKVVRFKDGRIMDVEKFAFSPRAIAGKHFFSARGNHGDYIVSEKFHQAMAEEGLQGLGFELLREYSG
jgi:hypothetical protein